MEMDPEVARRLFAEGAVLVLLGVPERTEFGIDYNCWTVGPKFKGVKMIPPGFHFVFFSAVSKQGQSAPRTGFFHFFKQREVMVKRWDAATEDLTEDGVSTETVERIRGGLKDLDSSLGAYPYESLKKWVSLTNHISEDILTRIQPINGRISSVTQIQSEQPPPVVQRMETSTTTATGSSEGDESSQEEADVSPPSSGGVFAGVGEFPPAPKREAIERAPVERDLQFKYIPEASLRFSEIPKQKYPDGATPTQITKYSMDFSYTLESMLTTHYHNVYDAFEHWKSLVKLLCFCEDALVAHKELFTSFISVLHFQLKEVPEDFFVDIVSRNNFLTTTLQTFFSTLAESGSVDKGLVKRGLQFRDNLTKKYKWDFSTEPDDFAPTIVENSD